MIELRAGQLIYGNVEKDQSPVGRSGFHTLFRTQPEIDETESAEIEAALFYVRSPTSPVKRIFFTTSRGNVVLAQVIPLIETDRGGRGGRTLGHALVIQADLFDRADVDPFSILYGFTFVTTIAKALEWGDFATGNIPSIIVAGHRPIPESLGCLDVFADDDRVNLLSSALKAKAVRLSPESLTLTGTEQHVEGTLRALLSIVPTTLRRHCSFDTYFFRGNLKSTPYWAVGLPQLTASDGRMTVDYPTDRTSRPVAERETAYGRWLLSKFVDGDRQNSVEAREEAYAIGELIDGRPFDSARVAIPSAPVLKTMFAVNAAPVREGCRRRVENYLSGALAARVLPWLEQQPSADRLRFLAGDLQADWLLQGLFSIYRELGLRDPGAAERRCLRGTNYPKLLLLEACWTGNQTRVQERLLSLSDSDYVGFVKDALAANIAAPELFVIPRKGSLLLDVLLSVQAPRNVSLSALTKTLIAAGESPQLERLTPWISGLTVRELSELERIIRGRTAIPESFTSALGKARAALPSSFFTRLIRRILHRADEL